MGAHLPGLLRVKFRQGLDVRLREGRPTRLSTGGAALDPLLFAGTWTRTHHLPEADLEALNERGRAVVGDRWDGTDRYVPDHNLEFDFRFDPASRDTDALIALFHADELVEYARPAPRPVASPLPPDYEGMQGYLDPATDGVGAHEMRGVSGGWGTGVELADLEYSWNFAHEDLPPLNLTGGVPADPFNSDNHGTAVMGEIFGEDNGYGVTGIAPSATPWVVPTSVAGVGFSIPAAVTNALGVLEAGDVMLIEQQMNGPNFGDEDYVPVEWDFSTWLAIVTAVLNGVTVVEAAGNGGQDLDSSIFQTGNGGHYPFKPGNGSGAIIVGAGASPGSTEGDRSRLDFSTYGSAVTLQGWGHNVTTTGYGGLYSAEGKNHWYTAGFNGTSSASPIVAGACVLLQSTHKAAAGSFLAPADVLALLADTGSPQQSGDNPASEHIGPRPYVPPAYDRSLGEWVKFGYSGTELGTYTKPHNTLGEGLSDVPTGGRLHSFGGTTGWTGVITKSMELRTYGGSTVIGG